MKRIRLLGFMLFAVMVWGFVGWAASRMIVGSEKIKLYHVADAAGDRFKQDTLEIISTRHYGNRIYGTIIFDSTTYDTGAFGNSDTVIMVVKSVFGAGEFARFYTLDSSFKVAALGGQINDTLFVNEDTDTLGERVVLIYRIADTLNAGVANTAGDTAFMFVRWQIQHDTQD